MKTIKTFSSFNEDLGSSAFNVYDDLQYMRKNGYTTAPEGEDNITGFTQGDKIKNEKGKIGQIMEILVNPNRKDVKWNGSDFIVYVTYNLDPGNKKPFTIKYTDKDIKGITKI